jgi:hypothetical protein
MYEALLTTHLVGAGVTAVVAAAASVRMWVGHTNTYRPHAIALGAIAGFEVLTGVLLALLSPEITALSLCANVALYLSAVFAIEGLLFIRIKQNAGVTARFALSPIALSLVLMAGAIGAGV